MSKTLDDVTSNLNREAKLIYHNLSKNYVDLISFAVSLRLTPSQTDKGIRELEELELIETKTSIRRKK